MSIIYEYTQEDMNSYINEICKKYASKEMNNIEMMEIFEKHANKISKKKRGRPSKNYIDDYKIVYNSDIDTEHIDFPIQLENGNSIFKIVIFKDIFKVIICNENESFKENKVVLFTNYNSIESYCENYISYLLKNGYYFIS